MNMEDIDQRVRAIVGKELSCAAHNLDHVERVYRLCLVLAEGERDLDLEILKLAALLHDIARVREDRDDSGQTDHAVLGAEMAGKILRDLDYPPERATRVAECITTHRFRSGKAPQTKEAQILFDADKLDVIGAIGVARSFMLAGEYGEKLYSDEPLADYVAHNLGGGKPLGRVKQVREHTSNLEYELKLKHIPERLYTSKARQIAADRVAFMDRFFERLKLEITGQC